MQYNDYNACNRQIYYNVSKLILFVTNGNKWLKSRVKIKVIQSGLEAVQILDNLFIKAILVFGMLGFGNPMMGLCHFQQPPITTGIEGQVWLSRTCPETPTNSDCPPRPYQSKITVANQADEIVAEIKTDANGHFYRVLKPGIYKLKPQSPRSRPLAAEQVINVVKNVVTKVTINYDSGIR